ncbi:hypothetical protein NLC26_02545 [Candidatus Aminicenantes bacterium AC-708-M15]|nr:hypothetical protein [SCandidatus Aminicenantes bacterium Aminicenantia_JdfR_composite]MCP2598601.1 hypothetical protein [Candidatus Aminicenantes bacterium AC-335-L06]MCP2604340.1 hypothetical protein [Candidatus Aminicenantes bacterium AC-708-M15]
MRMLKLFIPLMCSLLIAQTTFAQTNAKYIGADTCKTCHGSIYVHWKASGHANMLRKAEDARKAGVPKPDYVGWSDILYVVGFKWKTRYLNNEGYFITEKGRNQFNIETEKWADYHAGEVKKYTCGECHTTGYDETGSTGYPGIVGSWAFEGIQCEACHGPGSIHTKTRSPADIIVDRSSSLCGQCHIRGEDPTVIPAKGGFIRHHEQYQELLQSPHKNMNCVTCHDPHKRAGLSTYRKFDCSYCHAPEAEEFKETEMAEAGVTCTDCHMAYIVKTAVKRGPWEGDIKTHLFRINIDPNAPQFTPDGKYSKGWITLGFACLRCHADRSVEWAASRAPYVH